MTHGKNPNTAVLEARKLGKHYRVSRGFGRHGMVEALNELSFQLAPGRTLAVVGESGSGKSTLAKQLVGIETPSFGDVLLHGKSVLDDESARRDWQQRVRMIFQNPYSSLNPRARIRDLLAEPLRNRRGLSEAECMEQVHALMDKVGLSIEHAARYPHMFSGGQRQRVAIARALILEPDVVIADEPVSALDVSVQAQVLNLLDDLQHEMKLAYLFISHDLGVVRHVADEILVMYLGRTMEQGKAEDIFTAPAHPYTQALLASTPSLRGGKREKREVLSGELPSPLNPPPGCAFHKRCPKASDECALTRPALRTTLGRVVACHHID